MPNDNLNINTSTSQRKAIAEFLQRGNALISMQALNHFGWPGWRAELTSMRQAGMPIETTMIQVCNRDGKLVRVAEYRLAEGKGVAA